MIIRDATRFNGRQPQHAEGHICLSLTDPLTGKIKEQIKGKNHVFTEQLFKGMPASGSAREICPWNAVNGTLGNYCALCLNDDGTALDTSFPYLRGQTIGYGLPSTGSSGTTRGAYNAANQVIAASSVDKIRWKWQYDFTTAQANGTIRNIGLTNQYSYFFFAPMHGRVFNVTDNMLAYTTSDGRYAYSCTTAGILTKYDMWAGTITNTTIDLSAIVGTSSTSYKLVGYAPKTGKYYICVCSSTAALRKMYVFSDNTFSALENTYSTTNVSFITSDTHYPLYIYDNYAYYLPNVTNTIYKADFVNNIAYSIITLPTTTNPVSIMYNGNSTSTTLNSGSVAIPQGIVAGLGENSKRGIIFNPTTDSICVYLGTTISAAIYTKGTILDPNMSATTIGLINSESGVGSYRIYENTALTTYVLPEPVVKTSANGMTVTYELEVYW